MTAGPRRGLEVEPGEALRLLRDVRSGEPSAGPRAGAVLRRPKDVVLRVGASTVPWVMDRLQASRRGHAWPTRLVPDRTVRARRSLDRAAIVADAVPEGRRLEAAIPARQAGGTLGSNGATVASGTRAVNGVGAEACAVLAP